MAACEPHAASWTEALKVLPARERLAWQRTITADVIAQESSTKQGPFSRAYASAGHALTERGALPFEPLASSAGHRVAAVTNKYPSTADFLAAALREAFDKAKVPLPTRLEASATSDRLEQAILQISLDRSYSVVVAKAMQRRLATDCEWNSEVPAANLPLGTKPRFEYLNSIADGSLVASVTAASVDAAASFRVSQASATGVSGSGSSASSQGNAEATSQDAILDSMMDELFASSI